jgi:outer membrane protein OmpA-like peptidoglycan-associated protein
MQAASTAIRSTALRSTLMRTVCVAAGAVLMASGCANMTDTQRHTATGAGVGAAAGAAIGAATAGGNRGRSTATGAAVGAGVGAIGAYIWSKKMEEQRQKMEQASRGTGIDVTRTADNRLKLNIPADAGFDTNRSEIRPGLRAVLDRFAATMNEHAVTSVQIVGHTDSTGSDSVNNPLSLARAQGTRDYLVAHGVAGNRIATAGRGEHEPIASNADAAGRALNRRVEIYIAEAQQ